MADVRVTALPAATSLAVGDVLHGVQAADSQDKQVDLQSLTAFINSQTPQSPVGGLSMDYLWSTSTSSADPGSGNVAVNNVDPYSATQLFISDTNNHGNNVESVYSNLAVGDAIGLWEQQSGRTIYYTVNGAQTDNTTWYSIPVTLLNTGATGTFSASEVIEVFAISNPDRQTPSGGTTGQYLGKASATDFDTSWQTIPATNIGHSTTSTTVPLTSSTGSGTTLPAATTSQAGVMTGADKTKLDGIASGAQVNVPTDLTYTASTRLLESSTGTDVTLPEVVAAGNSGLMTGADKTKLNGIATGATANTGTVTSVSGGTGLSGTVTTSGSINLADTAVTPGSYTLANVTIDQQGRITAASNGTAGSGTVTSIATSAPITGGTITTTGTIGISAATTSAAGSMSAADKTKLDGIATGATNVTNNNQLTNGAGYTTNTGTVTSIATSGAITGGTITTSGTITARAATTGQTGVVQLTDSTGSTSTTTAATPNSVKSANDNANGRLSTGGGTLTGGVYQTVRTISNNTAWNLSTGNLWTFAGGTIANPTNATAGMSGLIYVTAAITAWGANFDFPGGTAVNPATFPAICPFYVSATNVIKIGTPVEGIT